MNQIYGTLESLGLSKTEIKIYLAGLAYSTVSASDLARQTAVKRPTVYHGLSTLTAKGLTSKHRTSNHTVYTMTKPTLIAKMVEQKITQLEQQRKSVDAIVPLLVDFESKVAHKVFVTHYEGAAGVKLLLEELYYCRSRHWDIIAPRHNFFYQFSAEYRRYYLETRQRRGLTARTLWEKETDAVPERKLTAEAVAARNPRYLPASMNGKFKSVIYLFDSKVAFLSSVKELSGMLIDSEDVHSTLRAIFDALWEISEPYVITP